MRISDLKNEQSDYWAFVNDVANKLATILKEDREDPEYISQRKAYELFGQGAVKKWVTDGLVEPHRKGGKIEYRTALLKELKSTPVDYYDTIPKELHRVAKKFK